MTDIQMPAGISFVENSDEKHPLQFTAYAAMYLLLALVWLFFFYVEVTDMKITGPWKTEPEKVVEAQRVPVEQPEEETTNGRTD